MDFVAGRKTESHACHAQRDLRSSLRVTRVGLALRAEILQAQPGLLADLFNVFRRTRLCRQDRRPPAPNHPLGRLGIRISAIMIDQGCDE